MLDALMIGSIAALTLLMLWLLRFASKVSEEGSEGR